MDRGARDTDVNGRVGKGISALLLLALLLVQAGCHWGGRGGTPPPPGREELAGDNTAPAAVTEWLPPAVATDGAGEAAGTAPADNTAIGAPETVGPAASPLPEAKGGSGASPPPDNAARSVSSPSVGTASGTTSPAEATPSAHRPKPAAAPHPDSTSAPKDTLGASPPAWARSPEELVYRVDFIGITMGYARFRYDGKGFHRGKDGIPPERAGMDVGGPLVRLPDQRHDRLLSRRGDARADPAGVHASGEGERRRGPLQPGDGEDHVPVPAVGGDPEAGRHDPFRLRPGERRLLFPVAGPGRRGPSAERLRGPEGVSDLLARSWVRADPDGNTGRWTRSRSFR